MCFYSTFVTNGYAISIWPFLVNGFPLVNSDAGAYVLHAINGGTPIDRSVFYSYFIRYTSFRTNLSFTIFGQGLIGASLLIILLQQYFEGKKLVIYSILTAVFLSIFTPYAWITSQLNPDVFMGYFGLALLILLFLKVNRWVRIYLYLIITLCASIHNSILLFSLIFLVLGIVYSIIKKEKQHLSFLVFLLLSSGFVYILSAYLNQKNHQIFSPNPSSHVFLMSRLAEMGIMKQVLDEECVNHQYQLCNSYQNFKGRQWSFMWENGYPHSDGKWLDPNVVNEYNKIIKIALFNPKIAFRYLSMNFIDAFYTLFGTNVSDGIAKFEEGSSPWNNIQAFYPNDFERFQLAKQQQGNWRFDIIDKYVRVSFWILCFGLLVIIFIHRKQLSTQNYSLIAITIL